MIYSSYDARNLDPAAFEGDYAMEIRESEEFCWTLYKSGKISRAQMIAVAAAAEEQLYRNLHYFAEISASGRFISSAEYMLI